MKILITGGAGFIGSHLARELAKYYNDIAVIDNLKRWKTNNLKDLIKSGKIRFIEGDIRDYKFIEEKTKNADVIYHLASQASVVGSAKNPDYSFTTNVIGTYNILKASAKNKIKKIIFTSSREVYGDAQYIPVDEKHPLNAKNIYGCTKICSEALCNIFASNFGLNIVILRLANVYGPGDKDRVIPIFLKNSVSGKDLIVYGGDQILDFVWVGDVVKVLIYALKKDRYNGKTINVGSGKGTKIKDFARLIKEMTKSNSRIVIKPKRDIEVENFVAKINLPFKPTDLRKGLKMLIEHAEKV